MKKLSQFFVSRWLMLAIFFSGWSFLQGINVGEGLWQGSGLHGYFRAQARATSSQSALISVWNAFVQMWVAAGFAVVLVLFGLRQTKSKNATS